MLPNIEHENPCNFFNGACQGTPGSCGSRAVLWFDTSHYFFLKFTAGQGTNNHAEFYTLWILLKTAGEKELKQLQVFGDSKLLIDWANQCHGILNLGLLSIILQVHVE